MSIGDYIKTNKLLIGCNIAIIIVINLILFSSKNLDNSLTDTLYMDSILIIILLSVTIFDLNKQKRMYKGFIKNMENTEAIASVDGYKNNFYTDSLLKVLKKQSDNFFEKEDSYKKMINELQEYITQWVHDLKVNIAICDLLLEEKDSESSKFHAQIEQMKFSINQVLNVTRANHYNKDIVAEEVEVCQQLRSAIKDNTPFFINKNIEINTNLKPFIVISDKKWIHYILSQILNNSSKYTPKNGRLEVFTKEDERAYYLHLRDNGVGIPKGDINRIFEKGFTGKNGRLGTKSTGMGLYYAKNIANTLNIDINVISEVGLYTEFILIFYKLSDY